MVTQKTMQLTKVAAVNQSSCSQWQRCSSACRSQLIDAGQSKGVSPPTKKTSLLHSLATDFMKNSNNND